MTEEKLRLEIPVLLPGAAVGPGATVTTSVVMGQVGAGATLVDAVIGADGRVAAGAVLERRSLPAPVSSCQRKSRSEEAATGARSMLRRRRRIMGQSR